MWQRAAVGFKEAPNQVPPVREGFLKEVVCCNGRRSRSQLGEGRAGKGAPGKTGFLTLKLPRTRERRTQ